MESFSRYVPVCCCCRKAANSDLLVYRMHKIRQVGPEVYCDVCICGLQFGKSLEENKDDDLQNIT